MHAETPFISSPAAQECKFPTKWAGKERKGVVFWDLSSDSTDIRKPAEGGKSNRGFQLCKLTACRGKKDRVGQTRGNRISINSHADLQGSSFYSTTVQTPTRTTITSDQVYTELSATGSLIVSLCININLPGRSKFWPKMQRTKHDRQTPTIKHSNQTTSNYRK